MQLEIYDEPRTRQHMVGLGQYLMGYMLIQAVMAVFTLAMMFNMSDGVYEFVFIGWLLAGLLAFFRYIRFLLQLRRVVFLTHDGVLDRIFKLELARIFLSIISALLLFSVQILADSWIWGYLLSLPAAIIDCIIGFGFLKWLNSLGAYVFSEGRLRVARMGLNAVIAGAFLGLLPPFIDSIAYLTVFAMGILIFGYVRFSLQVIREFHSGGLGDINVYATPEMYSGLGPSSFAQQPQNVNDITDQFGTAYDTGLCPHCGAPVTDPDSPTCTTCGQKL